MTPMWHERILYVSYMKFDLILSLSFLRYQLRHDINEEFILMADIQHPQKQITLYIDIFLNWGGNNERNVKSLIMILLSASLDSLSPPSNGSLTMLL